MNEFGLKKDVIDFIVNTADKMDISHVVLFGSRAKNTYSLKSDIDLAVLGCDYHRYVEALEERCPTLLSFDCIDLRDEISDSLRRSIEREGVILYG